MEVIINDCFQKIAQLHHPDDLTRWKIILEQNNNKNELRNEGFMTLMNYEIRIEQMDLKTTQSKHTRFLDHTSLSQVSYTYDHIFGHFITKTHFILL